MAKETITGNHGMRTRDTRIEAFGCCSEVVSEVVNWKARVNHTQSLPEAFNM